MTETVTARRIGRPPKLPTERAVATAITLPPAVYEWLNRECARTGANRSSAVALVLGVLMSRDIGITDIGNRIDAGPDERPAAA
jgi:hypothetical protein